MCERLDTVHDVGIAFPLDHYAVRVIGIENVVADLHALALAIAHESLHQIFARIDDLPALVCGEGRFAHDESIRPVLLPFRGAQASQP